MSWDVVKFNSLQKISSVEELDDTQLVLTNFCSAFENHFKKIAQVNNYREIKGKDFTIDYLVNDDKVSNMMFSLHGERMPPFTWSEAYPNSKFYRHPTIVCDVM